jgi:hypothetical protein
MPKSHDANFALIEANYLQAAKNYYNDMAATRTPLEVQKVEQNYQECESAWALALISTLSRSNQAVEQATAELKKANAAVKASRAARESLTALLGKLQLASSLAGTLVRLAAV